jgi:hypothetical protein
MIVRSGNIISRKLCKPFVRLFWHCVRVSKDGGHVKGFIKVIFPRVRHWSKGKGTVEKGFDNGRLLRRPSLVNIRRFEPPLGKTLKGRRVLGRWSCQMSFKKSSSKVEGGHPLAGVVRKDRERLWDSLPKCC